MVLTEIRKMVSGNRRRLVEKNVNLDLTYITNQIIAMSFPSSGLESYYRNPIGDVKKFMDEHHGKHLWIINTSERTYDKSKFNNQVTDYHWPDHHGPPFHFLFIIAK